MSFFYRSRFKKFKRDFSFFSFASFLLGVFLALVFSGVVAVTATIVVSRGDGPSNDEAVNDILAIEPVNAAEIYHEFTCACCGKPLDPDNICCGDMAQKIDYIDILVEVGLSKDEIMLKAVKKFGINSLAKAETQQEIKDKLAAQAPADAPKIVFEQTNYDFGDISQAEGVVFTYFDFKNEGQDNLTVDKLTTSCGCTTASIVYAGKEGPIFSMPGHGKSNPQNWSVSIAPGDGAQLKVYYDPNVHEDFRGTAIREIHVFSNDPVDFEKEVIIELNQIP